MITIELKKELDYETYLNFHNFSVAEVDFGLRIKKDHPEINSKNYKEYIDRFYKENKADIVNSISELVGIINQKSDSYFSAIKKYFNSDLNKENYRGYISIFDCNPRFIESKSFQVFYKKSDLDKLRVCFHEITHFAFFDYFEGLFPKEYKSLDKNNGILWELSEIIDVILLNEPEFRDILQKEEKLFYPNLEHKLEEIRKIWEDLGKRFNGEFIQKTLIYLRDA